MPKRYLKHRSAFTLIEVMVAVMIVSVVIAALLQMQGETTHKFFGIKKMMQTNQYNSFLIAQNGKYGFEKSNMDMSRLVEDFDLESTLRRKLKALKVELLYDELKTVDTSEFDDSNGSGSGLVFEIGDTSIKTESFRLHLMRVRTQ
jgi:prepilin-type N-terminal cleavage/methylation domain-containing protein